MPIHYKLNIIQALKEVGYSTYRLRKEKILGEATLQKIRNNELVSWDNISTICRLLNCQPGDIIKYLPDEVEEKIIELTELREKELREYYEDSWKQNNTFEETLQLEYQENIIPSEIESIEDYYHDTPEMNSYIKSLYEINNKYRLAWLQKRWDEIESNYKTYFSEIQTFFEPFILEFNETLENERQSYINTSVKKDLEADKANIEQQSFEYFSNN